MKILVTSTSFQDSKGKHQEILRDLHGVEIDYLRGPLLEEELKKIAWDYEVVLMGDDEFTDEVLFKAKEGGLKLLSKYGVGLDKVDLLAAEKYGIEVRNCPGVNSNTVSEHVLALMLLYSKNLLTSMQSTKEKEWKREINWELKNKNIAIIGMGKIGKEVAKKCIAFGMSVFAFDPSFDTGFANNYNIRRIKNIGEELYEMDIISLHCGLSSVTKGIISKEVLFDYTKKNVIIINTARADLVDKKHLAQAVRKGFIQAYLSDVWFEEPISKDDTLVSSPQIFLTPHIASRTIENIEKQGIKAVKNIINYFN